MDLALQTFQMQALNDGVKKLKYLNLNCNPKKKKNQQKSCGENISIEKLTQPRTLSQK